MLKANRLTKKLALKAKHHSPEILMTVGVVGAVASTVMACKATLKVNDILEESKETIDKIKSVANDEEKAEVYSPEDAQKDMIVNYVQTGVKLVKLYGPALAVGTLSITSILAANNILKKRSVALAAAYTALDTNFKGYRSRVIEKFGEKIDQELRYNVKAKEIEVESVDENGNTTIEKKTVDVMDGNPLEKYSEFARFYDDGCKEWTKSPEYNLAFLRAQQSIMNDRLKANGYLFLNDVYDALGIPRTQKGQIVGWVYDENNPVGDNYVDFGIYDMWKTEVRDFVNGYERSILLDFNVDGVILELMK